MALAIISLFMVAVAFGFMIYDKYEQKKLRKKP